MSDLGPIDPERMRRIEGTCREIGELIGFAAKQSLGRVGFCLILFSFEGPELTYMSNASREDVIRMLEEFIRHARKEGPTTSAERN
jgi:hypothetical protein